jgi:mono/diheme cytochrome c family protein
MKIGHWLAGAGVLLVAGAIVERAAEGQMRPPRPDPHSGAYLYRVFCASCHGEGGRGDGAVADLLKKPPSDLTRLASRSGGVFPREAVIRTIDGRTLVPAHGTLDMPVWGDRLKINEGDNERIVAQRLEAIASHLESIQAK